MTNIKTGVEQRDPYEDGSLGGLKDNRHASKFKRRRESSIENWEESVEWKEKELQKEKQKMYFAQVEVIDNRLDSLLKIQNNVRLIEGNHDRVVDILDLLEPLVHSVRKDLASKKKMLTQEQIDRIECNYSN
jgi:predicted transcriptional regulator